MKEMDPKNVDRAGKVVLATVGVAIVTAVKKYGPVVAKKAVEVAKKMIVKS